MKSNLHSNAVVRSNSQRTAGFTLLELMITVVVMGILMAGGATGFRAMKESSSVERAARIVTADVAFTRSRAIQTRSPVWLVADEANRAYVIRGSGGVVMKARVFDATSDVSLSLFDIQAAGDSIGFNSRGILTTGVALIDVGRPSGSRRITLNALGRSKVDVLP